MNTAFDIKLEAKDLFRFNMYQTYTGLQGWISIILGILAFVMAGITFGHAETMYTILYIGVGILFLVYVPGSLRRTAMGCGVQDCIKRQTGSYIQQSCQCLYYPENTDRRAV